MEWNSGSAADYLYDPSGNWIGRYTGGWDVPGVMHMDGRMLAMYLTGKYFLHPNLLGSTTIDTSTSGGAIKDVLFYPWGNFWASTSLSEFHFSGFENRDNSHGLDPALFRMYNYGLGWWMSPDPQSLNRYAYVLNNPTTLTDPLGLQPGSDCEEYDNGSCTGDPTCDNFLDNPWGCEPPPCVVLDIPCDGYGGGYGGSTGGGGAPAPGAPPAAQPPLAGGSEFLHNPLPCLGPAQLAMLKGALIAGAETVLGLSANDLSPSNATISTSTEGGALNVTIQPKAGILFSPTAEVFSSPLNDPVFEPG